MTKIVKYFRAFFSGFGHAGCLARKSTVTTQNPQSTSHKSRRTQGHCKKKRDSNNMVKKKHKKANVSLNGRKKQRQIKTQGHNNKKCASEDADSSRSTPGTKSTEKRVHFGKKSTTHSFDPNNPASQPTLNNPRNAKNGGQRKKKKKKKKRKGEVNNVASNEQKKVDVLLDGHKKQQKAKKTLSQKKKPTPRPTQKGAVPVHGKKSVQIPSVTAISAGNFKVIELYYNFERALGPYATFVAFALMYAIVCVVSTVTCVLVSVSAKSTRIHLSAWCYVSQRRGRVAHCYTTIRVRQTTPLLFKSE